MGNKIVNQFCYCPDRNEMRPGLTPYAEFNRVIQEEIKAKITAEEIINKCQFCTNVPLAYLRNDLDDTVSEADILSRLQGKNGVYHLWEVENDFCDKHKVVALRCLYVGKGEALVRAKDHITKKWLAKGSQESRPFRISFYECENRISKYLEQLFLDLYDFELNISENRGIKPLYAYWTKVRYEIGTEIHHNADKYATKAEGIIR